ncbi:MAG TPA: hypothetical protein PK189_00645 [bacterium]|nr:hypothetical protein [bacterium]
MVINVLKHKTIKHFLITSAFVIFFIILYFINSLRLFKINKERIDVVINYNEAEKISEDKLKSYQEKFLTGIIFNEIKLADLVQEGSASIFKGREIIDAFRIQQIVNIYMWEIIKDKEINLDDYYIFLNDEVLFNQLLKNLSDIYSDKVSVYSDSQFIFDGNISFNFIIRIKTNQTKNELLNTPLFFNEEKIEKYRKLNFKIFFESDNIEKIRKIYYDKKNYLISNNFIKRIELKKDEHIFIAEPNPFIKNKFGAYKIISSTGELNGNINTNLLYLKNINLNYFQDTKFYNQLLNNEIKLNKINDYYVFENELGIWNIFLKIFSFICLLYLLIIHFNFLKIIIFFLYYSFFISILSKYFLFLNLIIILIIFLYSLFFSEKNKYFIKNQNLFSLFFILKKIIIIYFIMLLFSLILIKSIDCNKINYYFNQLSIELFNEKIFIIIFSSFFSVLIYFLFTLNLANEIKANDLIILLFSLPIFSFCLFSNSFFFFFYTLFFLSIFFIGICSYVFNSIINFLGYLVNSIFFSLFIINFSILFSDFLKGFLLPFYGFAILTFLLLIVFYLYTKKFQTHKK